MSEGKKPIDWERIELDFRAGLLSVREIASAHGISHAAINKRAKRDNWVRDLAAKIKARADELVSKQVVSTLVSAQKAVTERVTIEANAERIAQVRGEHRADIRRGRTLVLQLLSELEAMSDQPELFRNLGEIMSKGEEGGPSAAAMEAVYRKVIDLPARIDGVKKLSETLKYLIGLEREAYGIEAMPLEIKSNAPRGLHEFYGGLANQ